jgi:hypothetical protein
MGRTERQRGYDAGYWTAVGAMALFLTARSLTRRYLRRGNRT